MVNYGKKSSKTASTGQMSLFDAVEIDVAPQPVLKSEELSNGEAIELAEREEELLGVNLSYDEFKPYRILSQVLCNMTIKELAETSVSRTNVILIAKVTDIQYKNTKNGDHYASVEFTNGGFSKRVFLFGEDYRKNIRNIFKKRIYLIKVVHNAKGMTMLKFAQQVETINQVKYVSGFGIRVNELKNLHKIRTLVWLNRQEGGVKLLYRINEHTIEVPHTVWFDGDTIDKFIKLGCNIKILKAV